jgi:hypothetical protein
MSTWGDIQAEHVREAIDTSLTDGQIEGSIATAITLVDARLSDKGLSNPVLSEIARYVSAHIVSVRDTNSASSIVEEKLGDSSIKYNRRANMGVDNPLFLLKGLHDSKFGQIAIMLDSTGTLGNLGGKAPMMVSL